jgi:hypothetical protein
MLVTALVGSAGAATHAKSIGYRWKFTVDGAVNIDFGNKQGALRNGTYLLSWHWESSGVVTYHEVKGQRTLSGAGETFTLTMTQNSQVTRPDFLDPSHQRRIPVCTELGQSGPQDPNKDFTLDPTKFGERGVRINGTRLQFVEPAGWAFYPLRCKPADFWMGLQGPGSYDFPAPARARLRAGHAFEKSFEQAMSHAFGESHPGAASEPHSFVGYNRATISFDPVN